MFHVFQTRVSCGCKRNEYKNKYFLVTVLDSKASQATFEEGATARVEKKDWCRLQVRLIMLVINE